MVPKGRVAFGQSLVQCMEEEEGTSLPNIVFQWKCVSNIKNQGSLKGNFDVSEDNNLLKYHYTLVGHFLAYAVEWLLFTLSTLLLPSCWSLTKRDIRI